MADPLHPVRYPGESDAYRAARTRLLQAELDLRRQLEAVAALRRELPLGGRVENVFIRTADGIFHSWAAEMLYVPTEGHPRHVDLLWPIWNFFDLTPEGRGTDWMPKLSYE